GAPPERSLKDTSCGICGFGRLKSWQVQKVMRNTSSLVLKYISTLTLSQRMNCVLATYGSFALSYISS
uniref:Uncharacterized protein n=1 Tax=Macaca nemestrina TaxID=9545 RepID=A0A2K6EBT3_MACNE